MMKGGQNRVTREKELASTLLDAGEVDIGPALEQASDVLDGAPAIQVNVLVQEPLTFTGEGHHHVGDDSFGNVIGFPGHIEGPLSVRFKVEVSLVGRCALREATEQERLIMIGAVFVQPPERLGNDNLALSSARNRTSVRLTVNFGQHLRRHDQPSPEFIGFRQPDVKIAGDVQKDGLIKSSVLVVNRFAFNPEVLVNPALFPSKNTSPLPDSRTRIAEQSRTNAGRLGTLQTFQQP